jgi:hypothetical protein
MMDMAATRIKDIVLVAIQNLSGPRQQQQQALVTTASTSNSGASLSSSNLPSSIETSRQSDGHSTRFVFGAPPGGAQPFQCCDLDFSNSSSAKSTTAARRGGEASGDNEAMTTPSKRAASETFERGAAKKLLLTNAATEKQELEAAFYPANRASMTFDNLAISDAVFSDAFQAADMVNTASSESTANVARPVMQFLVNSMIGAVKNLLEFNEKMAAHIAKTSADYNHTTRTLSESSTLVTTSLLGRLAAFQHDTSNTSLTPRRLGDALTLQDLNSTRHEKTMETTQKQAEELFQDLEPSMATMAPLDQEMFMKLADKFFDTSAANTDKVTTTNRAIMEAQAKTAEVGVVENSKFGATTAIELNKSVEALLSLAKATIKRPDVLPTSADAEMPLMSPLDQETFMKLAKKILDTYTALVDKVTTTNRAIVEGIAKVGVENSKFGATTAIELNKSVEALVSLAKAMISTHSTYHTSS